MRPIRSLAFVLVIGVSIAVAHAATFDVSVGNFAFNPTNVTITAGDTVKWTFNALNHNVRSDTGLFQSPGTPSTMPLNGTYSFTFPDAGLYLYYCTVHGAPGGGGMAGTVTVVKNEVTMSLTTSKPDTVYGEGATLTATVSPFSGTGTPTGTVTFYDGNVATILCDAATLSPVSGGAKATCSTAPLGFGSHGIFANYNGDANFNTFFTGPVVQTVHPASSTTALESSVNPSEFNQEVTFTATITILAPGSGTAGGTMTLVDGASFICQNALVENGSGSCASSTLAPGLHNIQAVYFGDGNVFGSTSPSLGQSVKPPAPSGLSATAQNTTEVLVQWGSVINRVRYELYMGTHAGGTMTLVADQNGTSVTISSLTPGTTYLFQVLTIGTEGASPLSPIDVATTVVFTDGNITGALIKGQDMSDVRTAVNAMHIAANLGPATFTDDPSAPGTLIKAGHVIEARMQLDAARLNIGVAALTYGQTIAAGTTLIKAGDITELFAGTQ